MINGKWISTTGNRLNRPGTSGINRLLQITATGWRNSVLLPYQPLCSLFAIAMVLLMQTPALAATIVISNERSGDLLFMSEAGETTDVIPLCRRPRGMAQHKEAGTLFIACSDDNKVIEFNPETKKITRTFPDISGAMSLVFHEPSGRLLVSNEGAAQATVLDTVSGSVLATLPTGLEPDGVAMSGDGELIFIASENAGLVHVFDGDTYQMHENIMTNLRPRRLAVREQELWVTTEMGSRVEIFSTDDFTKLDEIIFSPRGFRSEQLTPVDVLFDPGGNTAFIALGSANNVVIVDAVKREIIKYILVGRRPWGLGITDDGKRLFVLNGLSDDITIIDMDRLRPIKTSRTGLVPHAVQVLQ
ncbi:MAG: hypothetical protein AB8B63_07795 [Granulosicoccus sp.]